MGSSHLKQDWRQWLPSLLRGVATQENNLMTKYPEMAAEWNYAKKDDLKPENFTFGSVEGFGGSALRVMSG